MTHPFDATVSTVHSTPDTLQQLLSLLSKVAVAVAGLIFTAKELWAFLANINLLAILA